MPIQVFASANREFEASLSDVEDNLQFVEDAAWLKPRLGKMLDWNNLPQDTRIRSQAFMKKDVQLDLIYRGMLVSIAGAFEQLIRRILRETVAYLSQPPRRYADLDNNLVQQNVMRTGRALATILDPPDHLDLNYLELCSNIGTCTANSQAVSLNPDAFALFFSTLTPTKLQEVLRRIGLKFDWNAVGRHQGMRALFATKGTRDTANDAERYLKTFIQTRNKLAHRGSGGISVSPSDLQIALRFFRQLSQVLIQEIDSNIFKTAH